jgi:S-formylglutathione hydrolase FrmB
MRFYFLLVFCSVAILSNAARVDTVSIYSNAMHHSYKCVVIKPSDYKKQKTFPAVYLLHGYAGDFSNWITRVPQLKKYADDYHILIICPEGGYSTWYINSPLDSTIKFETYISKEVVPYIDAHYKTVRDRKSRAITGLSMGGHGAFFIAFRNPEVFGACGSMSGLMDLKTSANKYDLAKRIGDTINYAQNWKNYSVINVVESYPKDSLAIIFDCGTSDPFYKPNMQLHEKLLALKIPHDFIVRPGNHNWNYWANAVQYQLLFFRNYFQR